jgi:multimeric flavodoxin WrbA
MTSVKKGLLLCGSPKPGPSTSRSLLDYLAHELLWQGLEVQVLNLNRVNRDESLMENILGEIDKMDIIVVAFPLYIDGLPFPTIYTLERIADHRRGMVGGTTKGFAAVSNCGFPEATQNQTALATCEEFAREAGFR